jgi:hypothetical protein
MSANLKELARLLHEGLICTGQTSLRRRAPRPEALPLLQRARHGLRLAVEDEPGNIEAWRLLSQAEEMLLEYGRARVALEKVLVLAPRRDRRDLKRLALLQESETWWGGLGLTPLQLAGLGDHLAKGLYSTPCDDTPRITRAWLQSSGIANPDPIIEALGERGGFCDCEVLFNIVM